MQDQQRLAEINGFRTGHLFWNIINCLRRPLMFFWNNINYCAEANSFYLCAKHWWQYGSIRMTAPQERARSNTTVVRGWQPPSVVVVCAIAAPVCNWGAFSPSASGCVFVHYVSAVYM